MKKKRGIYNFITDVASQIIAIALGIIIPRLFLTSFGSEMNGFLNSIGQVFAYMGLLEAGVGTASLQALYKPVCANDKDDINAILSATKQYYNRTGIWYSLALLGLAVVYPFVVPSSIPKMTMILVIIFHGIPSIISYLYQGKYTILLRAEGKNYINTVLTSIISTLTSIAKVILLLEGCNVVTIQLVHMLITLIKVVFIEFYIHKHYKWICLSVKPNIAAISQKNAALINKICDLIFRNTDTILLTIFCDLKVVSVYALFSMLYSMVHTLLSDGIGNSVAFIMGQTYNTDLNKYTVLHDFYETYRMALTFALYNIALVFIIPFMKLYTSGINDADYLDPLAAVLFAVMYIMTGSRACESDLIGYAQHFEQTKVRCIIEAVINLVTTIILVNVIGIYGALIGTIVALLYRTNDMFIYANNVILKRSAWVTYKKIISHTILFLLIMFITRHITWALDSYLQIIGSVIVYGIVVSCIYFILASILDKASYVRLKSIVGKQIKKAIYR